MGDDINKQFTVLEYGDYGCIFEEEIIGEFGQCVVYRHSPTEYVVASNVKYEPFYEERHFTNRRNARNFARKASYIQKYILKHTYK